MEFLKDRSVSMRAAAIVAAILMLGATPGASRMARPESRPVEAARRATEIVRAREESSRRVWEALPPGERRRRTDNVLREWAHDLYQSRPDDFRRAEHFRDDLPFFRVRLPRSERGYDAVLKSDMLQRYQAALAAPLTTRDITVLAADFSSRPGVEREARRMFETRIPAARRTISEGLDRMRHDFRNSRPTMAEIGAALEPYRGKVLMLVGHIDQASQTMTWSEGNRQIVIDLRLWSQVAGDRGVGLLPLGCYSSESASIGIPHAVNSGTLLRSIAATLAGAPTSFGEMFGLLTREQHVTLDVDPFQGALFHDRIDLVSNEEAKGEMLWNPATALGPAAPGAPASGAQGALPAGDGMEWNSSASDAPMSGTDDAAPTAPGPPTPNCGRNERSTDEYLACLGQAQRAAEEAETARWQDDARRQLADAKHVWWKNAGWFFGAIFLGAVPFSLGLRLNHRERRDQSTPPGLVVLYMRACIILALIHGAAFALVLPGWAVTGAVAWMVMWGFAGLPLLGVWEGMTKQNWPMVHAALLMVPAFWISYYTYAPLVNGLLPINEIQARIDQGG
jgi:hypothetical protein